MTSIREGGFLITKIHHLAGRIFAQILRDLNIDIKPGQGRVLFALWRKDEVSANELAEETKLGKSTLTELVDRLKESGMVERTRSKVDRRRVIIKLTAGARQLHQKYDLASSRMTEIFYDGLGSEERDRFESLLRHILQNLIDYEEQDT
ncbi:MAG: MarR family transcriptional regulator [Candidatus Thorarchaeota archaeon]|nr:MarR family transcriptional regulator [Candidatus Thorarchaeota archaeon]